MPLPVSSSSIMAASSTGPLNPTPRRAARAARDAARPPFMSEVPRPYMRPSCTAPPNGSVVQPSPTGTTSVCPSSRTPGPAPPCSVMCRLLRSGTTAVSTTSSPSSTAAMCSTFTVAASPPGGFCPVALTSSVVRSTSVASSILSSTACSSAETPIHSALRQQVDRPSEPGDSFVDPVRWSGGEAETQGVGEPPGRGECRAGDERDALGQCPVEQFRRVDAVVERHPEEESALGVGPSGDVAEVLAQRRVHRLLAPLVFRPLGDQVVLQVPAGEEPGQQALRREVGARVHRLLGVDQ